MRQQRQRLLFLLPLALGLACGSLHRAHAHAHAHHTTTPGFVSSASISGRRPAVAGASGSTTATAATATATVALPPSPGGGHDDDLSTSSSHICHAWCGCARRRQGRQQRGRAATRLWAAKKEAEAEEAEGAEAEAAEEQGEEEEAKELTPEEKQRNELKAEIKEMEAALAAKRNELTEAQDRLKTVGKEGYMRLAAEVETYKRRRADGLTFVRDEAAKEAVKQLVPVFDLFEELEAKFAGVTDEASLKVLNGYRGLQNTFTGKAERLGLKAFIPAAGDEYDPTTMEAEFVDGDKDDVVLSVTEKGYEVGGRMVRRAGVTVSVTAATRAAREKVEAGGDGEGEEAAEGAEE